MRVGDDFHNRFKRELYEHLNEIDVVRVLGINIQRLSWLGHIILVEENAMEEQVFDIGICECLRRERPCLP